MLVLHYLEKARYNESSRPTRNSQFRARGRGGGRRAAGDARARAAGRQAADGRADQKKHPTHGTRICLPL